MKILYIYKKNMYAALEAAYIHLKLDVFLLNTMEYDLGRKYKQNTLHYIGMDEEYNEVYVINYGRNIKIFKNIINSFGQLYKEEIKIIALE